jgi:hypothetical protein
LHLVGCVWFIKCNLFFREEETLAQGLCDSLEMLCNYI